ncbi:MAG: hypothetical protein HZB85_03715 [Deltaproteobacteria bacterium]|nr:hypothetical protein [Deltaproteobacteria bacterium]
MHRARKIIAGAIVAGALFLTGAALASDAPQKTLETRYADLYYRDDETLRSFGRQIGAISFFSRDGARTAELVAAQLEDIVSRVRRRLDMYPEGPRFNIRVYPTYLEIQAVYMTYDMNARAPIAFYAHAARSIYVSVADVTDGVLAHEIAHAVISIYFVTPPPARMQEILAQYVDRHLWDE